MDYLDSGKQFRHRMILLVGYVCVAVAIVIATLVLLYQAYGFGLGKNGTVIQNGLVFVSSQPNPADIYLNGVLKKTKTDTRLLLSAGIYQLKLSRTGYRDWQRNIDIQGGSVTHFDYPFLFPTKLTTTNLHPYTSAPGLTTQSPDRRWLLVQTPGSISVFDVYDLKNPTKAPTVITLPDTLLTKPTGSESWQLGEWADDNQHVVLQHLYDDKTEFILVDRQNPDQSVNLNTTLSATPTKLTLNNKKFDQYYLYDSAAATLQTASLKSPTPTALLDHVLAYQSYSNDTVLYATDSDAPAGKVLIKLTTGGQTSLLRNFIAGSTYLLDLTKYAGTLYVAMGVGSENKVYIYKDPLAQLAAQPTHALVPIQVLHVTGPDYLSFSNNTQFIVAEHETQFGVYDLLNKIGFNYTAPSQIDSPQTHATWMDGDRLNYISGGKLIVFDYDQTNQQTLMPESPSYLPFFSPDYKYVYGLASDATAGQFNVTQTSLLSAADR